MGLGLGLWYEVGGGIRCVTFAAGEDANVEVAEGGFWGEGRFGAAKEVKIELVEGKALGEIADGLKEGAT